MGLQAAIVLGLALQRKEIGTIAKDLDLPTSQALALYNKAIRKFAAAIRKVREAHVRDVELGLTDEREASERAYMSRLEPAEIPLWLRSRRLSAMKQECRCWMRWRRLPLIMRSTTPRR